MWFPLDHFLLLFQYPFEKASPFSVRLRISSQNPLFFVWIRLGREVEIVCFQVCEKREMALEYDLLNENVKKCQYAVRGELYLRASELQKEGKKVNSLSSAF